MPDGYKNPTLVDRPPSQQASTEPPTEPEPPTHLQLYRVVHDIYRQTLVTAKFFKTLYFDPHFFIFEQSS